ncbi:DUF1801 domain-containing protein [Paenibacillus antarcticus]|uniref:YdhG-like domain-containing protein n=1 Tax=Paenibacillus antarcticus TaxID=253703 RepID=A0A162MER1_9BACL|nr:DUF1801 domain-containing protein [Paenibacillus antarcticus]OAB47855.1 hypothetical protein PBAT_02975 [Paenibacillus antarcticus]
MMYDANSPEDYINQLPEDRKAVISELRKVILESLPVGFKETMSYGFISYVVPHSLYPAGYHCNPKEPLPFMSIASQKNLVAIYHMGVYADQELLNWFVQEYPKHMKTKLDMGKSCIRFKNMNQIPYALIGELSKKITVEQWIEKCDK